MVNRESRIVSISATRTGDSPRRRARPRPKRARRRAQLRPRKARRSPPSQTPRPPRIDFVWGREGNPGRDYEGGYGFSHIIAKHGEEAARRVPAILAYGKYFHDEQERDAYTVVLGNEVVSVKRETGNFLVVTSYASDKKATAYLRRGGQIENKAKDDSATFCYFQMVSDVSHSVLLSP